MHYFLYRIKNFMLGRYGFDQLSLALFILSLFFNVLYRFIPIRILLLVSYAAFIFTVYRICSKDIYRRQKENQWFLVKYSFLTSEFKFRKEIFDNRKEYKYLKCPSCKHWLRVPRGKGMIEICCRNCNNRFIKKV